MSSLFPIPEMAMIQTFLLDGSVLANDFSSVGVALEIPTGGDGHTTGHGRWAFRGRQDVAGSRLDRYQATFISYHGRTAFDFFGLPGGTPYSTDFFHHPVAYFKGSVRPRVVAFLDRRDPDVMKAFIQPYMYSYTNAQGIVNLKPDLLAPNPDPVAPLPQACNPGNVAENPHCLGTLQVTLRRIQP